MLVSPFEAYEISMGINRDRTQGRMHIRVGTSGKREPYAKLSVMASNAERIVGELGKNQSVDAMVRIQGEIPEPSFGYLIGSLLEHRKIDYALANDLVARDSDHLVYVGELGRHESEMSFRREKRLRAYVSYEIRERI